MISRKGIRDVALVAWAAASVAFAAVALAVTLVLVWVLARAAAHTLDMWVGGS